MSVQRLSLIYLVKELSGRANQNEAHDHVMRFVLISMMRGSGGAKRDRTADLLNANQALSQLSYSPLDRNLASTELDKDNCVNT